MSQTDQGFILTRHAGDYRGKCRLHYYGVSASGPFRLTVNNHKPLFFIPRTVQIPPLSGVERKSLLLKNFNGEEVDGLYFPSLDSYYNARRTLREQGIIPLESDVRPADRFLMERHVNGAAAFKGEPVLKQGLTEWEDPQIARGKFQPDLKWLSLDIETGQDGTLYSIALHLTVNGEDELLRRVLMRDDSDRFTSREDLVYCPGEKELLHEFFSQIKECDPDLIIGWHVIGFDLMFIERRCMEHQIPFNPGRGTKNCRIRERQSGLYDVEIEGRVVIDGPPSLRSAFFKFENYKLETVARELLGRGKDISSDTGKVEEIERRFREDKEALAHYNLEDTLLVTEIFFKTGIIQQLVTRSLITGLTIDKVHMSVAAFDHFMLPAAHRHNIVAPDVEDIHEGAHSAGGHVFTSVPGLYSYVAVLDFKSLYPTIMRTFFIDPLSRLKRNIDPVLTPAGIEFSKEEHVLPAFLEQLMEKRATAKAVHNNHLAQAVKILMNSFYGVMGTPGCRFYHWELPTAITGTGQWVLKNTASFLEDLGYTVLYGDTDSVFVKLKEEQEEHPERAGERLEKKVNTYFQEKIKNEFGVESRLELEFEKYYISFFLPAMRGSQEGARKRYVGQLPNGELELKGMEFVRSDWTELAKEFQFELFRRLFSDEDIHQWIRDTVHDLKEGLLDDKLVYRRKLNRRASEYTKTTPPHIKAVRKLDPEDKKNIREVRYIMTLEGAVPLELKPVAIDYQHYIDKQLKPIADGVLFINNETFDGIIDGRQLELF